jgi:hypothetical protein
MSTPYKNHASSVIPAQLSFLAIYNPTLGPTDETFADQLVFWYSRKASEARRADKDGTTGKKKSGADAAARRKAADREEENERLRQIGLAQGMIGFAKTFSDGERPVDSIETDKSRIVLRELENGWWILASIDLTRLPGTPSASTGGKNKGGADAKPTVEYSSREVSPAVLLTQQLIQAHWVFLLHHGPTLDELFVKLSRDKFCSTLERYWTRFAKSWNVLLHGNPAADVFGGIKLAAGGELGVGVGEEEWGSGEREVLEDLTRRTEGLVDVIAARFGDTATDDENPMSETEPLPWLGSGGVPSASDGIVFSGIDGVNRNSVRSISLWMQHIYAYGEYAYGVRDNPNRERRRTRRQNPPPESEASGSPRQSRQIDAKDLPKKVLKQEAARSESPLIDPDLLPKDERPQMYDRVASHDHATGTMTPQSASHPGIPPPIVSAAEQALNKATQNADKRSAEEPVDEPEDNTTMGIPDQYMKYMTFGLSSLAKSYTKKQPETRQQSTPAKLKKTKPSDSNGKPRDSPKDDEITLSHADPIPDGEELRAKIAQQIQAENEGHFVVGLKGDLSDENSDSDGDDATMTSLRSESDGSRILIRTLQVELVPKKQTYSDQVNDDLERGDEAGSFSGHLAPQNPTTKDFRRLRVLIYVHRPFMFAFLFEPRTSSLSYSGLYKTLHSTLRPIHNRLLASTNPDIVNQRLSIAQHQHQNQTSNVTNPDTQDNTNPIYSLLHDPATLSLHSTIPNIPAPGAYKPWPRLEALNVHSALLASLTATSTGPAADASALERSSKTARGWWIVWLRLPPSIALDDARPLEERGRGGARNAEEEEDDGASKTEVKQSAAAESGAGWLLDSQGGAHSTVGQSSVTKAGTSVGETHRVAFLVRKAGESGSGSGSASSAVKSGSSGGGGLGGGVGRYMGSGMWSSLGMRGIGGGGSSESPSSGSGGAAGEEGNGGAAGMGGFGVDARKYVEGLLSLNR